VVIRERKWMRTTLFRGDQEAEEHDEKDHVDRNKDRVDDNDEVWW